MAYTFRGGIHPEYSKKGTSGKQIEVLPPAPKMYFPLLQHIGAVCEPLVSVGDEVKMGQLIAKTSANISSYIHSSVSGKVSAIISHPHPNGTTVPTIVIDNDGLDTPDPSMQPCPIPEESLTPEYIIGIVRDAGLVGMGGAGFPTHAKLESVMGKVDTLIVNGAECEPYLTSDHRLMLEHPDEILGGIKLIQRCLKPKQVYFAVENNKPDVIRTIRGIIGDDTSIKVAVMKTKYPQGGEKQLIKAITGREVPSGKLPAAVGCTVLNVETFASVYRAYTTGRPVISRIVTVTGSAIAVPKNLLARIGTPISYVVEHCGGFAKPAAKIIVGGPMMGTAQYSLEAPVIKTSSGIICVGEDEVFDVKNPACIRCGRCVQVCPMGLEPLYLHLYAKAGEYDECEKLHALDCIECGCCSFECPGRLYLVQTIRVAKSKIQQKRRSAMANAAAK